jgi:hypothetical protein
MGTKKLGKKMGIFEQIFFPIQRKIIHIEKFHSAASIARLHFTFQDKLKY